MTDKSDEVVCVVCGRSQSRGQCEVIEPTAKERLGIEEMGQKPLDEYIYCRPCWKNLSHPVSGPAFMGSLFEVMLSRSGVVNAEMLAKRYHAWLANRAKEPKPS